MACPTQFFCRALRTVGLVLFYYVFSIGITFYNKWLMKVKCSSAGWKPACSLYVFCFEKSAHFCPFGLCNVCFYLNLPQDFHFPLFMTLVHLVIIFCFSTLTRFAMQCWMGKPRVTLPWKVYLSKVAPTGKTFVFVLEKTHQWVQRPKMCLNVCHNGSWEDKIRYLFYPTHSLGGWSPHWLNLENLVDLCLSVQESCPQAKCLDQFIFKFYHRMIILCTLYYSEKVIQRNMCAPFCLCPSALATALDIGLSNWSFLFITISL